jgi:hypothetical protein
LRLGTGLVCAILLLATPSLNMASAAATVPGALYGIDAGVGALIYSASPQSSSRVALYPPNGSVEWAASSLSAPAAFASMTASDLPALGGVEGSAPDTIYYFEFVGPPGINIPIIFSTAGYTNASASQFGIAQAESEIGVEGGGRGNLFFGYACAFVGNGSPCINGYPPINQTAVLNILSDNEVQVELTASASAFGSFGEDGLASADADPYFYIDPTFPLASEFTLVISAGVGNSPLTGIPEPSTLAMLGAGALGFIFRRYRGLKTVLDLHLFLAWL